jgi:hypothetical protein
MTSPTRVEIHPVAYSSILSSEFSIVYSALPFAKPIHSALRVTGLLVTLPDKSAEELAKLEATPRFSTIYREAVAQNARAIIIWKVS